MCRFIRIFGPKVNFRPRVSCSTAQAVPNYNTLYYMIYAAVCQEVFRIFVGTVPHRFTAANSYR